MGGAVGWWGMILAGLALLVPAAAEGPSYEAYWAAAMALPHKLSENANCTEIVTPETIYLFTKPGNPDHPALFVRSTIFRDGKMYIRTVGHSFRPGASKPDVAAWMNDPFHPAAERMAPPASQE
jgi:hypothetical protein